MWETDGKETFTRTINKYIFVGIHCNKHVTWNHSTNIGLKRVTWYSQILKPQVKTGCVNILICQTKLCGLELINSNWVVLFYPFFCVSRLVLLHFLLSLFDRTNWDASPDLRWELFNEIHSFISFECCFLTLIHTNLPAADMNRIILKVGSLIARLLRSIDS